MRLHEKLVISTGTAIIMNITEWGDIEMTRYDILTNVSALYPLLPSLALEADLNVSYTMGTSEMGGMEEDLSSLGFQVGYFGIRAFF